MPDNSMREIGGDLLSNWRVAERDVVSAQAVQNVAARALVAAEGAEEAAHAAEVAAAAALDAALQARNAADRARQAARHASDETQMHTATAQGDKARADQALTVAIQAEADSHRRFQRSQSREIDVRG